MVCRRDNADDDDQEHELQKGKTEHELQKLKTILEEKSYWFRSQLLNPDYTGWHTYHVITGKMGFKRELL